MTDDHLHAVDPLPVDLVSVVQRQAAEINKLKGFIGWYVSLTSPDTFWGDYSPEQIEAGLSGEVRVVFKSDGGVTVMTGMGS